MQGIIHHNGRWRLALITVAGGLTAACSTYHPLDHGSDVPWAKASRMTSADGAQPGAAAPSAAALPVDRHVGHRGDRAAAGPAGVQAGDAEDGPAAGPAGVQVAEAENGQVADAPPVAAPVAAAPVPASGDRYVVRRGETLWSIAKRVDVPLVRLAAANQIASPYDVVAGQRLRIPGPGGSSAQLVAPKKVAARQHATGEPPRLTGQGFLWPVNGKVIGDFGPTGHGQRRDGIDIAARQGAPVLAAEAGIVAYAGEGIRGYGRLILLRHADGYITAYAHNAALLVEVGEVVERGQVIARVGSTGDATRSLLYFELRKGRTPIDPETVLVRAQATVASTE